MSNKILKKGSAALALFALIISYIASLAKRLLAIDILSLDVSFRYWLLSIPASSFQSTSCIRKGKVGNKYSKSLSKLFKLHLIAFKLVALSKASSISLFNTDQLITVTQK